MSRQMGVYLTVDRDGQTKGIQLSIDQVDADGGGHGYRIAGPKYNGSSAALVRHRLTARDLDEIESYLKKARALLAPPPVKEGSK